MQVKLVSWNVNGIRAVSAKEDWRWFEGQDAQCIDANQEAQGTVSINFYYTT